MNDKIKALAIEIMKEVEAEKKVVAANPGATPELKLKRLEATLQLVQGVYDAANDSAIMDIRGRARETILVCNEWEALHDR